MPWQNSCVSDNLGHFGVFLTLIIDINGSECLVLDNPVTFCVFILMFLPFIIY